MDIERLAVAAVMTNIALTDVLSPFINDGDKEPSWDGNIYIHQDKRRSKNGIKRVPVQVKGQKRKHIPSKKDPRYSVSVTDLDNWNNDGGAVLFVVLIDETGMKNEIYYSPLLPVLIRHLKKYAKGRKKINIPLKRFPLDEDKKVAVMLDFYDHMKKQTSFANALLPTIDQLEKEGVLDSISMTVTTYGRVDDIKDVESLFLKDGSYVYAHIKGSPIPQPLPDIVNNIHIMKDVIGEIKVNNRVFYKRYRIIRFAKGIDICFGKSMRFTITYEERKGKLVFSIRGMLSDYIQDTKCIIEILENRELLINGSVFAIDNTSDSIIEKYKQSLRYYLDIRKMLDSLGVKEDLECDTLTDRDKLNIRNFTNALVYGKDIGFSGAKNVAIYGHYKIGNLNPLIWADKRKDSKGYRIQTFFSRHVVYIFDSNDETKERPYRITHYVMLSKNDILDASNMDYSGIVDGLAENDMSPVVIDRVTLFMLEMLKAYDEQGEKSDDFINTIEKYSDWLIKCPDNSGEITMLNRLQIIRRKRELNITEISELQDLRRTTANLPVRCGANILLGKMDAAQDCFDQMSEEEKNSFIEYPICFFGKPNIHME